MRAWQKFNRAIFESKKGDISEISYWGWLDRNLNATGVFISMMPMIFIFGSAKNYLQEKKLGHFEKNEKYSDHEIRSKIIMDPDPPPPKTHTQSHSTAWRLPDFHRTTHHKPTLWQRQTSERSDGTPRAYSRHALQAFGTIPACQKHILPSPKVDS